MLEGKHSTVSTDSTDSTVSTDSTDEPRRREDWNVSHSVLN